MRRDLREKVKLCLFITIGFLVPIVSLLLINNSATLAAGELSTIQQKAKLEGVYNCYRNGSINSVVTSQNWQLQGWGSMISPAGSPVNILNNSSTQAQGISCGDLFGSYSNSFPSNSADAQTLRTTLYNMGYDTGTGNTADFRCATYVFNKPATGADSSVQICSYVKLENGTYRFDGRGGTAAVKINYFDSNGRPIQIEGGTGSITLDCKTGDFTTKGPRPCGVTKTFSDGESFDDFARALATDMQSVYRGESDGGYTPGWSMNSAVQLANASELDVKYQLDSMPYAANRAIKQLSNGAYNSRSDLALSYDEKIALLMNDLKDYYGGYVYYLGSENSACGLSSSNARTAESAGYYPVTMNGKTCYIGAAKNTNGTVAGYDSQDHILGANFNFKKVVEELNKYSVDFADEMDFGDPSTPGGDTGGTEADEAGTIGACYSGTGVLGWIVCPVMEAVGAATGWIYGNVIEPALQVKASTLFSQDNDSGIYSAWSTFRSFSNILFVIAFVIVIIAQLTGIGVSNYNIKKILPRLIMVVILVNISYIICQLAVDVSNILGSTLRDTFANIKIAGAQQDTFFDILGTILNGLGLATVGTFTTVTILSSSVVKAGLSYLAIPLLLTIIGCFIAIVFFFILLAVRQAGVIILVILSPVAVICYALPNTKSIFDRWRKLFTSMLFVYPICGLLVGGGQFVGALMLSMVQQNSELGFFYAIAAMLVNVMPFFLVPSLLKNSMALAGNIGARIASAGAGLRNGLNRGVRNSEVYKEHQQEKARIMGIRRNQTRVGRYSKDPNAGGGLIGRARRALNLNDNLSERQTALLAQSQSSIDQSTGNVGKALQLAWENDGSADNLEDGDDSIMGRYIQASKDLMEDPNNIGALERQKAAYSILASSNPGRSALNRATSELETYASGLSGEKAEIARSVMGRTATNLLREQGSNIGKSPLLEERLKAIKKARTAGELSGVGSTAINESIKSMSTRTMAEMNKRDLDQYLLAARRGELNSNQIQTLSNFASKAMSDQHYKGSIAADALPKLQALASMPLNRPVTPSAPGMDAATAAVEEATNRLGGASKEQLDQIREGLRDSGGIKDTVYKDALGVEHHDNAKTEMINNLSDTLMRAMDADDDFSLDTDRAKQISEILRENGVDTTNLASRYGMSPDDVQGRLDLATGVKIPHPPRQRLTDLHSNWRRATAADVAAATGRRTGPHARIPFAVDDWVQVDGDGRLTRLDARSAKEAEMLETADLEADRARLEEEFRDRTRRRPPTS